MKKTITTLVTHGDKLGLRLAIVLGVALLPLMIVSVVRSQSVLNQAVARSQAALIGETLQAVRDEVMLVEQAKTVAQALGRSIERTLFNPTLCHQTMLDQMKDTPFSFIGYYDTTGYVPCSTAPEPFSFGVTPDLVAQVADPRPTVLVNEQAPASGTSVIYSSYPVFGSGGDLMGFTAVSVPHSRLRDFGDAESGATFLTLNRSGTILTAPGPLSAAQDLMPVLKPGEMLLDQPAGFRAVGRDGVERLYSLVPVVESELYALSTWSLDSEISGNFYFRNPTLFPALMWFASFAVALFATSLFVTRHVVKLREAMRSFADTRTITSVERFKNAPGELRDVADSFIGMTDQILHDEAKIEDALRQKDDALRQKDVFLREVHHRVKNNLQLITSIMAMQIRQTSSREVRQLLQNLHNRVNSLATIHRSLYQTSGQADIRMDEHLDTIVRQAVRMASAREGAIDLTTDFAPLQVNPDQAVPLSLFVSEALTNALKYMGMSDGNTPTLHVTLAAQKGEQAVVSIVNSLPDVIVPPSDATSSGLGSELMEAFAEQLSGRFSVSTGAGIYRVDLVFTLEPLDAKPDIRL